MKVTMSKYGDGRWMAHVEGQTPRMEYWGNTSAEALGNAVRDNARMIGLDIRKIYNPDVLEQY